MAVRQRPVGPSPDQILATLMAQQLMASKPNGGISNPSSGPQKSPPHLGEPGYSEAGNEIAKAAFSLVAKPMLSMSGINPLLSALGTNVIGMPGTLDSARTLLAALGIGSSPRLTRAKAADASRKDSDPDLNGSVGDIRGESQAPSVISGTAAQNLVQSVFGGSSSSGSGGFSNPGNGSYNGGGGFGGGTNYTGPDTPTDTNVA